MERVSEIETSVPGSDPTIQTLEDESDELVIEGGPSSPQVGSFFLFSTEFTTLSKYKQGARDRLSSEATTGDKEVTPFATSL
jgi:hypothetical protein